MTGELDHRADAARWARALGVSREAVDVYLASEVIDLHIDSFIWTRVLGYRLDRRHGRGVLGARVFSQVDLPRLREARVAGGVWSITTNPLRPARVRARVFESNRRRLVGELARGGAVVCRDVAGYRAARTAGRHAAFLAIQGGNALDGDGALDAAAASGELVRVTLVHLSTSSLGATSAPGTRSDGHLTARGREFVRRLDEHRIFVDLAHVHRRGFFDAVAVHDRSRPLMVSHTGLVGVTPHWRNLDDDQVRAVADTGGVIGVMYQTAILGSPVIGDSAAAVVAHLARVIEVAGEDHAALGSDWDGAIVPPRDLPTCLELPRLVQAMLDRGWSGERVRKLLGGNFLRALGALRP